MRKSILALVLGLSLLAVGPVRAAPPADITDNAVTFHFPETATFHATISSDIDITSVVLEYGDQQQACGDVVAKAFPQITPGKTVEAEWTWEMRQSGSLPPGAQLWWRWRIKDANGTETVSQTETSTWLDDVHQWQTLRSGDQLRLHWYEGDQSFARQLAEAAAGGLKFNETQSGLKADAPIDLYIYANTSDLREAILYEPSWIGGEAFSDQNIVILGISEADLDWGKDAIVHELTHVLVGHLTFSCLGDVPAWLNEGLAVYSEGELDADSQKQFDNAVQNDSLLSVRSLSGQFSEAPDKANLSYSESYSLVKFLIETYGQDKMTALLLALRDGQTTDEALIQTYAFDVEGLEDAWRKAIGAQPRAAAAAPTAQPTPTTVPTIVPVGAIPVVAQVTATPVPTSSFGGQPTPAPTRTAPPLSLTLLLLSVCCFLILIFGVLILGFVLRNQNKGGNNVQ